ncbi:MAG TPA: signal recognition particle-docking protein FtsY, partial [Oscillospiraceae bacterium]|nr:signal recognition particle-docking protein FtsY [Oscillospiraceae bacterium]
REFQNACGLTGIVLTKLDGTARGGVVIGIRKELGIPIRFIGVGEQADDLQPFNAEDFARALFAAEEK